MPVAKSGRAAGSGHRVSHGHRLGDVEGVCLESPRRGDGNVEPRGLYRSGDHPCAHVPNSRRWIGGRYVESERARGCNESPGTHIIRDGNGSRYHIVGIFIDRCKGNCCEISERVARWVVVRQGKPVILCCVLGDTVGGRDIDDGVRPCWQGPQQKNPSNRKTRYDCAFDAYHERLHVRYSAAPPAQLSRSFARAGAVTRARISPAPQTDQKEGLRKG